MSHPWLDIPNGATGNGRSGTERSLVRKIGEVAGEVLHSDEIWERLLSVDSVEAEVEEEAVLSVSEMGDEAENVITFNRRSRLAADEQGCRSLGTTGTPMN